MWKDRMYPYSVFRARESASRVKSPKATTVVFEDANAQAWASIVTHLQPMRIPDTSTALFNRHLLSLHRVANYLCLGRVAQEGESVKFNSSTVVNGRWASFHSLRHDVACCRSLDSTTHYCMYVGINLWRHFLVASSLCCETDHLLKVSNSRSNGHWSRIAYLACSFVILAHNR